VVRHRRRSQFAILATLALLATSIIGGATAARGATAPPERVLIVLFDQMVPKYADQFDMPNYRRIRDAGTDFKNAYLGYMASETVIAHNVIVSGKSPKNMGWVDEAFRDSGNVFGKGADAMHITGDLSLTDFNTLVNGAGYLKLADYLHTAYPGSKFITVGEKSYAVESAIASTGDIGVRLSSRRSNVTADYPTGCRNLSVNGAGLNGRWREPVGKNVPAYLREPDANDPTLCGRFFINSDSNHDYGTKAAFPSFMYPEDGNRFFPGTDASAQAGHLGGDTWAADAAIAMMGIEPWSGMFITLGGIDKAAHMWGAQNDTGGGTCSTGAEQTHVRCAAENADVQLGKLLDKVAEVDAAKGGETLVVKGRDFVHAARAAGAGDARIMARHVLPNVFSPVIVVAVFAVANMIVLEATLSFLGLGVEPSVVTWGRMLNGGRLYLSTAWWLTAFPGFAIFVTVLAVNLLGDHLRDWLDPRLRNTVGSDA
jgi:hypothetical protein